MVSTYLIASRYLEEPQVVSLLVIAVTALLLTIGHTIVGSFRRLAETNLAQAEFVSIASHQLRTPLTSLKWVGSLIDAHGGTNGYGKIVRENTERMISLVNSLLDVTRIEAGTFPVKREEVNLDILTKRALNRLEGFAAASSVTMAYQSPAAAPTVVGDRVRLEAMIEDLLDNAIRYTPGKGTVEVSLEEAGHNLVWEVKDSGVGIAPHDQKRVFDKFFRAENVLKHQTVGTGLALYVSKALIEALGGKLDFTSEKGKGSKFWFTLPKAKT
jgi:signal transduction histidine kinase